MMIPFIDSAASRERGGWFPGMGAALAALGIAAGLAFILGLLSFICREPLCWIGAIPCFFGGLFFLWFFSLVLHDLGLFHVIQNSLVLSVGILMALNGVIFLVWLLPKVSAELARELEADDLGETNTRTKKKVVKLFGIATLIVGIALILIHAFRLF